MDEYERLEEDLQAVYADYMMKFRNMTYLEQTYGQYTRVEQDKVEVSAQRSLHLSSPNFSSVCRPSIVCGCGKATRTSQRRL